MKKFYYGLILFAVLAAISLAGALCGKTSSPYKTDLINRGEIRSACTATGTVNPITTVLVGTQASGRIKDIFADYNSPVTKGQLIALIDPATFEAQLEKERANLLSAKANLAKAQATFKEAGLTLARKRELFRNKVIGKSEMDAEETNHEIAKTQISVAEAQIVQTESAYKIADTNLQYTNIVSPVDGIVISRNVDIGQTVAATFQTPTLFTIAQDLGKLQINTNVDEADIGRIQPGQDAEFEVDAYPETVFTGKVSQVRNSPMVVQNVVTYDVVITVANPDLKLKPGMTANVSVITGIKSGILRVSNPALRFKPKKTGATAPTDRSPQVWIIKANEAVPVKVKIGITDGLYSELIDGELAEGQEVIVGYSEKEKK